MLDEVEASGDAERWVKDALDRGERLMGFGHRVYRAEDPRARVLRRTAQEIGSERFEVAEALEKAALAELQGAQARPRAGHQRRVLVGGRARQRRRPGRRCSRRMFTCARVGGLVGAHPRAEARGAADPPDGEVRRAAPRASDLRGLAARCEDVAQRARVLVGEAGERRRRDAACAARPRRAAASPCSVSDEHLDAAVVLGGRRSTRPRSSRRSTMPVTFELSHIERGRRARSSASARRARSGLSAIDCCGGEAELGQRSPCGGACRR